MDKIISLRKQTNLKTQNSGYGPERLQFHLQSQYGINLAKSTIGHILKRGNALHYTSLIPPKRLKHRKKHPKRYRMPNPGDFHIKYERT